MHVREELGIDPDDLPSARLAAGSSFASFAVGAFLPVLPYLFGATSMMPALVLTLAGLFLCGAFVTRLTPRPWWYGGLRQTARRRGRRRRHVRRRHPGRRLRPDLTASPRLPPPPAPTG